MNTPQLRGVIGQAVEIRASSSSLLNTNYSDTFSNHFRRPCGENFAISGYHRWCRRMRRDLTLVTRMVFCHSLPLRFFVANRPEPYLKEAFEDPSCSQVLLRVVLDASFRPSRDIGKG